MFVFSVVLSVINLFLWTTTQHVIEHSQDCLDSEGIQRLIWPASSSDLNPIENVWDSLGRQAAGRNYPPTNKNTLIRALTEEWDKLPQQLLDNVVQTRISKAKRRKRVTRDMSTLKNSMLELAAKFDDNYNTG
ncbi:hypothetical protein TNCV_547671 [Trichonephila clavipes]|nr:hypothetical protein TNCV_547671 [Trichonephila clavipes]